MYDVPTDVVNDIISHDFVMSIPDLPSDFLEKVRFLIEVELNERFYSDIKEIV